MSLCGSAAILVWVQAARRFSRRRPLRDPADGMIDVRCPTCGYRMIGLHESRCPECGTMYTLDELLARQQFLDSLQLAPVADSAVIREGEAQNSQDHHE